VKAINVPACGPRYWTALCIASVLGCNTGDAYADAFGFIAGLPLLALLFAAVLVAERRDPSPRQAWYWLAIVVVRTAATNLADFAAHAVGIVPALALLAALLVAGVAVVRAAHGPRSEKRGRIELPPVDAGYWALMLAAGTLGTALGDFSSFRSGLGLGGASMTLSACVLVAAFVGLRGPFSSALYYWFTIVVVRAAGTSVGDYFARHLGLAQSAVAAAAALTILLALWPERRAKLP
jgi:uncharacterized membrane-anchored protein